MKLNDKLDSLERYPFHMPGHKRNNKLSIIGSEIDITEIDGYDNLHNPDGIISEMEKVLSDIYFSKKSIISVNGTTCGILAAISAVCDYGDKIIIARNCHKSVYNACYVNNLDITYIEPEFNNEFGTYTFISQAAVDNALKATPDACAVVITSPTYEGFVSSIKCNIPFIIDAAHGAHFGLADFLPKMQNGDIIVQSLHKTLPALTQTAVVNIYNEKFICSIKKYMDIYETSSPSYVLMASVGKCIDFIYNRCDEFDSFGERLKKLLNAVNKLNNITLLKNDDISRIILMSNAISGTAFADILRNDYKIEPEGSTVNYVILISTVCDSDEGFDRLISALNEIDKIDGHFTPYCTKPDIPQKILRLNTPNLAHPHNFTDSQGRVSAEYVFAYPPASPLLAPGELITESIIKDIENKINAGVNIISDSNLIPEQILVY